MGIEEHMRNLVVYLVLSLVVVSCKRSPPAPNEVRTGELPIPSYTVTRAAQAITVDGKADEKAWQQAERCSRFVLWNGKESADLTDCKLLWDDKALYVLFVCRDSDIQAKLKKHDDPLYSEDVVEIFLDADADMKTYMELIVNPLGTTFDNYVLRNPRDNSNAGIVGWTLRDWKTAVRVDGTIRDPQDPASKKDVDKSWTVEMAIPFSSFVLTQGPSGKPPRAGDIWRVAITRYDRPDPKTFVHTAWSPPYSQGWPHITRRFGKLVFSTDLSGGSK